MKYNFRLSEALKERNVTQRQLANMLKLPEQCIGRWANGKVIPRIDTLMNICKALNCQPNDLLTF